MCTHRGPGDVEDCILTPDRITGGLVCVQHTPPIPRQRDDELDVIVPALQAGVDVTLVPAELFERMVADPVPDDAPGLRAMVQQVRAEAAQ